jgi:hypothetical protein
MSKQRRRYVVCIHTDGAEDLEPWKLYQVREDAAAERRGHLRVVDESGEGYLYPKEFFAPVEVPEDTERALATAGAPKSSRPR